MEKHFFCMKNLFFLNVVLLLAIEWRDNCFAWKTFDFSSNSELIELHHHNIFVNRFFFSIFFFFRRTVYYFFIHHYLLNKLSRHVVKISLILFHLFVTQVRAIMLGCMSSIQCFNKTVKHFMYNVQCTSTYTKYDNTKV